MYQTVFNRGSLPYIEQILHFTRARHNAIAANIANVENPTYKSIDAPIAEFKKAMATAVRKQNGRHVPTFEMEKTTNLSPKPAGGLGVNLLEESPGAFLKHDENNVDIDKEMAKLVKNSGLHNTMATLLRSHFDLLESAIRGRTR